jgi:hypothetical protein
LLQGAHEQLYYAGSFNSELAIDRVSEVINVQTIDAFLQRRFKSEEQLSRFNDLVLNDARAIREAINSGAVPFSDVVRLAERARKFRDWTKRQAPDADLVKEYYKAVVKETWADKLPTKTARWSIFTGVGVALDVLGTGGVGTAIGVAASALDAFVVDKLIQGWKPHHFIERELRPTLSKPSPDSKQAR